MKLVLHIGTEKTATTTVQDFVYANRAALASRGVTLSDELGLTNNRKLVAYFLPADRFDDYFTHRNIATIEDKRRHFEGFEAAFASEVRALSGRAHTMFISSEHFHSRLRDIDSIHRLKRLLDELFTEIRVVCYFREQSSMLESYYSTAIKSSSSVDFQHFGRNCSVDNHYYNFAAFFGKWRDVFGRDCLEARLFDRQRFVDQDVRKDMLSILLGSRDFAGFDFSSGDANVSLGYAGLEIGRVVNRHVAKRHVDGSRNEVRQQLFELLNRSRLGRSGTLPFPDAEAIYAKFQPSNVAFAREFLGHDGNPFAPPRPRAIAAEQSVALKDVVDFMVELMPLLQDGFDGRVRRNTVEADELGDTDTPLQARAAPAPESARWRRLWSALKRRLQSLSASGS
jgi:hypothetical protein